MDEIDVARHIGLPNARVDAYSHAPFATSRGNRDQVTVAWIAGSVVEGVEDHEPRLVAAGKTLQQVDGTRRHRVDALVRPEAPAIAGPRRAVLRGQQAQQVRVEAGLVVRLRRHQSRRVLGDPRRIAAVAGHKDRHAGDRSLEDDHPRGFVLGRQGEAVRGVEQGRDVVAPTSEANPVGNAQACRQTLESRSLVRPYHHQANRRTDCVRQRSKSDQETTESLLHKPRSDEEQQPPGRANAEFGPDRRRLVRTSRRPAALDARRQGVEAEHGRAVDAAEGVFLMRGDRQDPGADIGREDRALELGEVAVARREPVRPRPLRERLQLETGVGGVVDVEAGHFVHADQEVDVMPLSMRRDAGGEPSLPDMAAQSSARQHDDVHPR